MNPIVIKIFKWVVIALLLGAIYFSVFFILFGCSSFKTVPWNDKLPAQCNMALNLLVMHYKSDDKSGSVVPVSECFSRLKILDCQVEVFGKDKDGNPNRVEYENAVKFSYFQSCLTRK